uniref:Adrenoceptor alpha 1D n=1 Tax=Callorhinchus milii TaxID=7868 RepID=A0A4W3ISJ0_CALMI
MVNLSIQLNVSAGNWTEEPDLDVNQAVVLGLTLALFILFAIVGNIMVILSVACNRQLQTVTNYFIINLAVADLLLASIVLPFSATLEVLDYWCFGRIFCDIWAAVDVLCCTASIMSLCIISIDRYIGVRYSLRYPTIMTEKKAVWILIVLWLSSMVISIGPLLGWKEPAPDDETVCSITEEPGYALFSSLLSFYLPLMVILVMYFRIYVVARRTTKSLEAGVKKERSKTMKVVLRIHCKSAIDEPKNKGQQFRSSLSMRLLKFSREKKAAKTLGIVVGVFILCWLPFFIVLPLGAFFPLLKPSDIVFKVIFWLGYFNSCINPIIYPCSSKEFKRAFIRLLKCQCRRRRRPVWRVYDHHWRSSIYSSERGSEGDIMSQAGVTCCLWPAVNDYKCDIKPRLWTDVKDPTSQLGKRREFQQIKLFTYSVADCGAWLGANWLSRSPTNIQSLGFTAYPSKCFEISSHRNLPEKFMAQKKDIWPILR